MPWQTYIEWIGVASFIANAVGAYRGAAWSWLAGMPAPIAYGILFWHHKLYADMGLQVFFIVTSLLGWRAWLKGGPQHDRLPITALSWSQRALTLIAVTGAAGIAAIGFFRWTDATHPWWDSLNTSISIAAQLLMVRKKIDGWFVWNASNLITIALFSFKGLHATAALNAAFFIVNCFIIRSWRRKMRDANFEPAAPVLASA